MSESENIERIKIKTYEELVWDKIVKLSEAKEVGEKYYFDELLDEIEMLFRLVPKLSNLLEAEKAELDKALITLKKEIKTYTDSINDDITRDLIQRQKTTLIEWDYRSDMLETILMILNEEQMIPFTNPLLGELSTTEEESVADFEPLEKEQDYEEESHSSSPPNIKRRTRLKQ